MHTLLSVFVECRMVCRHAVGASVSTCVAARSPYEIGRAVNPITVVLMLSHLCLLRVTCITRWRNEDGAFAVCPQVSHNRQGM